MNMLIGFVAGLAAGVLGIVGLARWVAWASDDGTWRETRR